MFQIWMVKHRHFIPTTFNGLPKNPLSTNYLYNLAASSPADSWCSAPSAGKGSVWPGPAVPRAHLAFLSLLPPHPLPCCCQHQWPRSPSQSRTPCPATCMDRASFHLSSLKPVTHLQPCLLLGQDRLLLQSIFSPFVPEAPCLLEDELTLGSALTHLHST